MDKLGGALGMDDVHGIAGRMLEAKNIDVTEFDALLNGILTYSEKREEWQILLESAYQRLAKPCRPRTRFLMMAYRNAVSDHVGVLRLMPQRFCGKFALIEMAYAVESALAPRDLKLAAVLAGRLPRAIRDAAQPSMKAHLRGLLAQCRTSAGSEV